MPRASDPYLPGGGLPINHSPLNRLQVNVIPRGLDFGLGPWWIDELRQIVQKLIDSLVNGWGTPEFIITALQAVIQFVKDLLDLAKRMVTWITSQFGGPGVTPPAFLKDIQTVLALLQLSEAWTTFSTAWNAIDWGTWAQTPQHLYSAWMALWNLLKDVVSWIITVLTNFLGTDARNALAAFDLEGLTAAVQTLQADWGAINWTSWGLIPGDLYDAYIAFWNFAKNIFNWAVGVITNLTNGLIDLTKAFDVFDLADLEAYWGQFITAWRAVDWAHPLSLWTAWKATVDLISNLISWAFTVLKNLTNIDVPDWFAIAELKAAWSQFTTAWFAQDLLTPNGMWHAWMATVDFIFNVGFWALDVLKNITGLDIPDWFEIAELKAIWQTYNTALNDIDWSIWALLPDFIKFFRATAHFVIDLLGWFADVLKNITGIDLRKLTEAFALDDLSACWNSFDARWAALNWASPTGWLEAVIAAIDMARCTIVWAGTVFHNLTGIDLGALYNAFEFDVLEGCFNTCGTTLAHINWLVEPAGLMDGIAAVVQLFKCVGNWAVQVINNLIGWDIAVVKSMFASVAKFISTVIEYAFGPDAAIAWQQALDLITGTVGAAPWTALAAIYHQFQDVLGLFGNPADIGTALFNTTTAIEHFITEVINPTGLIAGAEDFAHSLADSLVSTFLNLPGSSFNINDVVRAIQSIPANLMAGPFDTSQLSHLNIGALSSFLANYVVNGNFDTPNSLIGQGLWTWDGTTGPGSLSTSVFTDAAGVLRELYSDVISVAQGMVLNIAGSTKWSGLSAGGTVALTVAKFDSARTLLGYDTVATAASPSGTSSWQLLSSPYTVPAGVSYLFVRPFVGSNVSAGRVWFGGISAKQTATTLNNPLVPLLDASKVATGQFAQSMVTNLTTDISTINSNLSAKALATDLTNTWNTVITALGGTGSGLAGVQAALLAIPGANISGSVSTITTNIQNLMDAMLTALIPGYVAGSGTLSSITGALQAIPQLNITNLTSGLSAKALASDLTALLNNLGLGVATLTAITNRFANLSATGTMAQSAITNLVSDLGGKALASDLTALLTNLGLGTATLTAITNRFANLSATGTMAQSAIVNLISDLNARALVSDLTALMSNLGLGTATLTAITNRFANLSATGTMAQSAITNLVTDLGGKALATDLTSLMSNLGSGTATLTAITNRFANLSPAGMMPQTAITNLVNDLGAKLPQALWQQSAVAGSNLVISPGFEDSTVIRNTGSYGTAANAVFGYSTAQAHGGTQSYSIQTATDLVAQNQWDVVFLTNNVQIAGQPLYPQMIKVQPGQWFYEEIYVRAKSTNTTSAGVCLFGLFVSLASSGGSTQTSLWAQTMNVTAISTSGWTKLSGWVQIPAGYDLACGLIGFQQQNVGAQTYYIDDVRCVEETQAQALTQQLFGGTNILSTIRPANVAGLDATAIASGQFAQTMVTNLVSDLGGKALAADLTALLSNLGLGTATLPAITNRFANLTAGGTMAQSAIVNLVSDLGAKLPQSLWQLSTTAATNLVISPSFDDATIPREGVFGPGGSGGYSTTYARSGTQCYKIQNSTPTSNQSDAVALSPNTLGGTFTSQPVASAIKVQGGQWFNAEIYARAAPTNTDAAGFVGVGAYVKDSTGVNGTLAITLSGWASAASVSKTGWTKIAGWYQIPAGYDLLWPFIWTTGQTVASQIYYFDDARIVESTQAQAVTQQLYSGSNILSAIKPSNVSGLDATSIISGLFGIGQIPTSQLTRSNITDLGTTYTAVQNNSAVSASMSRRGTSTVTVSAATGGTPAPYVLSNYYDTIDITGSGISQNLPANSQFSVTVAGWYRCDVCFKIAGQFSAIWAIAPVLYKNNSVFKVGHDAVSFSYGGTGITQRWIHSSFQVQLAAGDYVAAGISAYNATGTISGVLTGETAGKEAYFTIGLMNQQVA